MSHDVSQTLLWTKKEAGCPDCPLRGLFAGIAALLFAMLAPAFAGLPAWAAEDALPGQDQAARQPNLIVILTDDLGYGDVQCYGGKIPTPHIDRLAQEGMKFTDAHSSSSVCTPTRYGLLTGRYNWRSRLKRGVLGGLSPRLIEPDRLTLGSFLQQQGYHTACFGKWHLGMDWVVHEGREITELNIEPREQVWNVDYGEPITNGPNQVGFDEFFGISGSLDMVPYTYIENDRVVELPTEDRDFPMMLGRNEQQQRTRKGPTAPGFEVEDVLPTLVRKSVDLIARQADSSRGGQPFFLYLPLASPHTPIMPTEPWQGKSRMNPYADFVMETDAAVGAILEALDHHGLADNTLIVVTSDNGCSPQAQFGELHEAGHRPSGPLRGHKADLFEGGHRIPLVARWPGKIPAGTESDQIICLNDIMATMADVLQVPLPADAGEDSISFWSELQGRSGPGRDHLVSHSINGSFAIRQGPWKLLLCPDSGGWSAPRPGQPGVDKLPPQQLYRVDEDLGEEHNLAEEFPEKVEQLTSLLERIQQSGESRSLAVPLTSSSTVQEEPAEQTQVAEQTRGPHVVFILADDLGWSDLGCYGGEIATPHLDQLAKEGLRYTDVYSTARCWPSRGALLTGYYAQQIRRDTVPGLPSGGRGVRPDWAPLLPVRLKEFGYRSYHVGKWHVDGRPVAQGFDRSYWLQDQGRFFNPQVHYLNDEPLDPVPLGTDYYGTIAIADHAIDQLREHAEKYPDQPFFQYIAFTAPHFPLHALPEDIDRYRETYVPGWDVIRQQRHERQLKMRLLTARLSPLEQEVGPPYHFPNALEQLGKGEVNRPLPWGDLRSEQQAFQAMKMSLHAAMIDRMDREIGRILDQLRQMGAYENTLLLFASDNGASAEIMVRDDGHDPQAVPGSAATYLCLGPGFSSAGNTPFRRHKTWVHEGGIASPFIVHWPRRIRSTGETRRDPGHLIDFVPTVMELVAGQQAEWALDPQAPPFPGLSLVPTFDRDDSLPERELWWLHEGNRALRRGDWKVVAANEEPWELYNLRQDRSELENLADQHPEIRDQLSQLWEERWQTWINDAKRDLP